MKLEKLYSLKEYTDFKLFYFDSRIFFDNRPFVSTRGFFISIHILHHGSEGFESGWARAHRYSTVTDVPSCVKLFNKTLTKYIW
jgi:hypothetical protein